MDLDLDLGSRLRWRSIPENPGKSMACGRGERLGASRAGVAGPGGEKARLMLRGAATGSDRALPGAAGQRGKSPVQACLP